MPPNLSFRKRLHVSLTVDFDAVSGYLGTGQHPSNGLSDYSAGLFSAHVGVPRLLKLFRKYGIQENVTWFVPGHSIESFPEAMKEIVASGAEIGVHGYSHEGAYQMNPEQERDVLVKCISLCSSLTSKQPRGYRAPLYQIRESTISLLREFGFSYDSSLSGHDGMPYILPDPMPPPPVVPDFANMKAEEWMVPMEGYSNETKVVDPERSDTKGLIEIPASWYTEDMTPLQFYPYTPNSQGYVSVDVVERMWWDRWNWIWDNEADDNESLFAPPTSGDSNEGVFGAIFPIIIHPDSAGRAHVIGMIERFIVGVQRKAKEAEESGEGLITFERMEDVAGTFGARLWRARND